MSGFFFLKHGVQLILCAQTARESDEPAFFSDSTYHTNNSYWTCM